MEANLELQPTHDCAVSSQSCQTVGESSAMNDSNGAQLQRRASLRAKSAPGSSRTVARESTYGWYPPATEPTKIVPRKPLLNSYERELLFKFWRSRYAHGAQRQRMQEAAAAQGVRPTAAVQTRNPVRLYSIPGECKTIEVPITQRNDPQEFSITVTGQRAKLFAPFQHLRVRDASARRNVSTPVCAPPEQARPCTAPAGLKASISIPSEPPTTEATEAPRKPPVRPKSALPGYASSPMVAESGAELDSATAESAARSRIPRRAKSAVLCRSRTAVPAEEADVANESVTIRMPKTYDEARKAFGWRFEVHNDPLGVKRPYLAKRLSYALPSTEPHVLPIEPKVMFTSADTFFSTTVPRAQQSFTIAPDFSSEVYNRKREEMQKKGSWNYRYKDFSFLY